VGERHAKFRPGQRAQGQNALNDAANSGIDGNEAFGVQLAEGDVERPLIRPNRRCLWLTEKNASVGSIGVARISWGL
jgi:hypothetical protein